MIYIYSLFFCVHLTHLVQWMELVLLNCCRLVSRKKPLSSTLKTPLSKSMNGLLIQEGKLCVVEHLTFNIHKMNTLVLINNFCYLLFLPLTTKKNSSNTLLYPLQMLIQLILLLRLFVKKKKTYWQI